MNHACDGSACTSTFAFSSSVSVSMVLQLIKRLDICVFSQEHDVEESVRAYEALTTVWDNLCPQTDSSSGHVPLPSSTQFLSAELSDRHGRAFEYEAAVRAKVDRVVAEAKRCTGGASARRDREATRPVATELKRINNLLGDELAKLLSAEILLTAEVAVLGEAVAATATGENAGLATRASDTGEEDTAYDAMCDVQDGDDHDDHVGSRSDFVMTIHPVVERRSLPELEGCPDEELRLSIEAELHELWRGYEERGVALDKSFTHVLSAGPSCGWTDNDHFW